MEVIRSYQALPNSGFKAYVTSFLQDYGEWEKIESNDFYVSDDVFLRVQDTKIEVYDNKNGFTVSPSNFSIGASGYYNITLFKVDSNCFALSLKSNTTTTSMPNYSLEATLFVDKEGDNPSVVAMAGSSTAKIINGYNTNWNIALPYDSTTGNNYYSYDSAYPKAQIVPLLNPATGRVFKNLKCVLYTPIRVGFTSLDTKKFLIFGALALPCGDDVTVTTLGTV